MSVLVHVNSEIDTFLVEENGDDDREEDRFMYAAVAPLLLAASVAMVSNAQQSPYYGVGSTVTGHVYCTDSNAPARFAKVLLKPVYDQAKNS